MNALFFFALSLTAGAAPTKPVIYLFDRTAPTATDADARSLDADAIAAYGETQAGAGSAFDLDRRGQNDEVSSPVESDACAGLDDSDDRDVDDRDAFY